MQNIPGYILNEIIYDSGKSLIYRGIRESDKQPVIIKTLKGEHPSIDGLSKLKHEYELSKKLGLEGVICCYALVPYANNLALIIEDFGGCSVRDMLKIEKIPIEQCLDIAIKIGVTLHEVHHNQIIHRDITPKNIIINLITSAVKITDFGIATYYSVKPDFSKNILEGTLFYISPEQTGRINRFVDFRTDFYSLGATLYEMVCGIPPFNLSEPEELIYSHIAKTPTPPHQHNPFIPVCVSDIIMKLLEKNPENRYQSGMGLASDLKKCLDRINAGNMDSFPLGTADISDTFQIPEKIYGREKELAALEQAFEKAYAGEYQFFLITGKAGIGKTALVKAFQNYLSQSITEKFALCYGAYDKENHTPYHGIIAAFQSLIREFILKSENRLSEWKTMICQCLGQHLGIMTSLIPNLELIVGKQPHSSGQNSAASQINIFSGFKELIMLFCQKDHPLFIFLDNMQWADPASIKLITRLDVRFLMIAGALRTEISELKKELGYEIRFYTSSNVLNSVHSENLINAVNSNILEILPLCLPGITEMLCDTLHRKPEDTKPLALLLVRITGGIPFFIHQALETLYRRGIFTYDKNQKQWNWDQKQITSLSDLRLSDDVVGTTAEKIKNLPENTRNMLKIAACIGASFDLKTLNAVSESLKMSNFSYNDIEELIRAGILLQTTHLTEENLQVTIYRFSHDRLQTICYEMLSEDQRSSIHLSIGRYLSLQEKNEQNNSANSANSDEKTGQAFEIPEYLDVHIFEIVNHLNIGSRCIETRDEKIGLAKLNLIAGKKARISAAIEAALEYFTFGAELLKDDYWETHNTLSMELNTGRAACEYLCENSDKAEALFNHILEYAREDLEKASITNIRITLYTNHGEYSRAVDAGFSMLEYFGVSLPRDENNWLFSLTTDQCSLANEMTDPKKKICMCIFSNLMAAAYNLNPQLFQFIVFKMLQLSQEFGISDEIPHAYICYAALLCGIKEVNPPFEGIEGEAGFQFEKLALSLIPDPNIIALQVDNEASLRIIRIIIRVLYAAGAWIRHRHSPIDDSIKMLLQAHKSAMEAGETGYAGFAAVQIALMRFVRGDFLSVLLSIVQDYLEIFRHMNNEHVSDLMITIERIILNLQGKTGGSYTFSSEVFDEGQFLAKLNTNRNYQGLTCFFIFKLMSHYYFGRHKMALTMCRQAEKLLDRMLGSVLIPEYYLYAGLSMAAMAKEREKIDSYVGKLKNNAEHCPESYLSKYLILKAELAKIDQDYFTAMDIYDQAIKIAQTNGCIQIEALSNELAARFYILFGKNKVAKVYMKEAHYSYLRWGADAKAKELEKEFIKTPCFGETWYLSISDNTERHADRTRTITTTTGSNSGSVDLGTVIRAYQSISGEIVLENLLDKLITIVMEHAGAQNCFLILLKGDELKVEAWFSLEKGGKTIIESKPVDECEDLARSVVYYTARTKESVVLLNAAEEGDFVRDEYVIKHKPRSVLCIPIIQSGNITGVLYLENNLTVGAFTPSRIEILGMLASQAAVALENAKLYSRVEESEKKFRSLYENAVEGIYQVTPYGKIISANPALAEILGYESETALVESGYKFNDRVYVNPEDRKKIIGILEKEGKVMGFETRFFRKDGVPIWISVTARTVKDSQNNILYYEGAFVDITEHKKREEAEKEREIAEAANKKIMSSIEYAKAIQNSLLPNTEDIKKHLPHSFFIWLPRDIVGGDIFSAEFFEDGFIIVVIDCTGHGVPGAFMTMIASSSLNRIIKDEGYRNPGQILKRLNYMVKTLLKQDTEYSLSDDGLDASIIRVQWSGDKENRINNNASLTFAGAKLPLIYFHNNELNVIKGDKKSLGYRRSELDFDFTNHIIKLEKNMSFYLHTDGYVDQIGGDEKRMFGNNRFKKLIAEISHLPFDTQKEKLLETLESYKGSEERQDDITVLGFRL